MRHGFFSASVLALATFALGCEEPIPPTPQGAFQVNFADTGVDCTHKSHQSEMGIITATDRTQIAVDGVKEAEIECTVSGAALGPFNVSATMRFEGTEVLTVSIPSIDAKATEATPAPGSAGFKSSVTLDFYGSSDPCDFYIAPAGPTGAGQGVKPGAAWLSFKCPTIVESMNTCGLNESYILLENCTQ
jgi:hypothetical protein